MSITNRHLIFLREFEANVDWSGKVENYENPNMHSLQKVGQAKALPAVLLRVINVMDVYSKLLTGAWVEGYSMCLCVCYHCISWAIRIGHLAELLLDRINCEKPELERFLCESISL